MNTLNELLLTIILLFCFAGYAIAENDLVDRQVIVMFEYTMVSLPDQTVRTDRIDQVAMPDDVRSVLMEASIQEIEKGFPEFRSADTLRVLTDNRIYRVPDWTNLFIITLPEKANRDSLIVNLERLPDVVYAEKNQMAVPRGEVIPSDEHFDEQWGLKNLQHLGVDIRATYAWAITTGSNNNILGVVDSGVQSSHVDLTGKVSGPGAFTGSSTEEHGTMVAGVAAAHGDNPGGGIAGVDWGVQVHAEEKGDLTVTAQAIDGAVSAGAIVINNSWGVANSSTTLSSALRSAYEAGVLLVHANPYNDGFGNPNLTSDYPNNLGPWIMNVGAIEIDGDPWWNTGSKSFTDVAAPGVNIISTSSRSGEPHRFGTGTSYAAPFVSGTATLMLSVNPNLKNYDLKQVLMRTASRYPDPGHALKLAMV